MAANSGRSTVLALSLIEFLVHGALLGVGAYFVFDGLGETLENIEVDINLSGIQFAISPDLFGDVTVFDTIALVLQVLSKLMAQKN